MSYKRTIWELVMYKINFLRAFILLFLTNALLFIGISKPEASDGEEEIENFRTVGPRRRLKGAPESVTSYLPPIVVNSPDKSIRECQSRAKFFVTAHNLRTYDAVAEFVQNSSNLYYASDLINLANHYRHIAQTDTISLASKIFNRIVHSENEFITNRHKSLSYLGLAKIEGRAESYDKAKNLAAKATLYDPNRGTKAFLEMMTKRCEAALSPVTSASPAPKRNKTDR